jgi:hypothetical protein
LAADPGGDQTLIAGLREATPGRGIQWRTTNRLLLRRGHYLVAAGLGESGGGTPHELRGNFVNLFDPNLRLQQSISVTPGCRLFLLDLDAVKGRDSRVLAGACKVWAGTSTASQFEVTVEGVANTPSILLLRWPGSTKPSRIMLDGQALNNVTFDPSSHLLWIRFDNQPRPRTLVLNR